MNNKQAKAIRGQYFALSENDRAYVSARVLGTNLARMDLFECKLPTSPMELGKIQAATWFFRDLESAIEDETK